MCNFKLELVLLSPALAGSGLGFGSGIDTDVVFDNFGLPFIPAKRIKGCLRDAATEAQGMFKSADITQNEFQIESTFGKKGAENAAAVYFSNLYLKEHKQTRNWLKYFLTSDKYKRFITSNRTLDTFTEIRQQTEINDNGIACDHSLRTSRMLRNGLRFYGNVSIISDDKCELNTLLLACQNFRRFGSKRNRGLGEVQCRLLDETGQPRSIDKTLEDLLCTA